MRIVDPTQYRCPLCAGRLMAGRWGEVVSGRLYFVAKCAEAGCQFRHVSLASDTRQDFLPSREKHPPTPW